MNQSTLAVRTTISTIAEGQFEIRTPATTRARLQSLGIIQVAATAQSLGVGVPAVLGVTPTTVAFQRNDPGDPASLITGSVAWGGARPTAPAIFKYRWNSAAVVGNGVIWSQMGLVIAISSALTVHNITAASLCDVTAVIDE